MILPEEFELNAGGDFAQLKIAKVYREYEAQLKANNALDFGRSSGEDSAASPDAADVRENYQDVSAISW